MRGCRGRPRRHYRVVAGTDPLKVSDWHTDFSALPSRDGLHRGFANALDSAWSPIEGAIAARPNTEQALFFIGHSLGGALALIAAKSRAIMTP
jgi:surfactin synthase thioesterase subunit